MVFKKSLFKWKQSLYNRAKANESRSVSPTDWHACCQPRGPSSPSSLLRKPLAQAGLATQRLIIQHPGFCLHYAIFDPLLPERRQQGKMKELNCEPTIVATAKQTDEWLVWKGKLTPQILDILKNSITVSWKFDSWLLYIHRSEIKPHSDQTGTKQIYTKWLLWEFDFGH